MIKKILFRADGNSKSGLGHMYRLFALIEIYKKKFDFNFITREESTLSVIPEDYNSSIIKSNVTFLKEPDWFETNYDPNECLIILDGYHFSSDYQKKLKQKGYKIIYIDDLVESHMFADVVINHSLGVSKKDFNAESYTHFALGTKYALLRPGFLSIIHEDREVFNKNANNFFVCFGGADEFDLTLKTIKQLLKFPQIEEINVLLGGAYKHKEIFELANTCNKIKIKKNLNEREIIDLMTKSHLAIVPASTTLYELCAVNIPVLSGYFVDNQKKIYYSLLKENCIYGVGDFSKTTDNELFNEIESFLNKENYLDILNSQKRLFDDKIENRFLDLVNYLNVDLRTVIESDSMTVFNWSNDPVVRKNSFDSADILLENHEKWFLSRINNDNVIFYMMQYCEENAGIVRYEIKKDHAVIGITVSKEFRGEKLGSLFLIKSAKNFFEKVNLPIWAYIKKSNIPSIKVFEKAGYLLKQETQISGVESFIYTLEK